MAEHRVSGIFHSTKNGYGFIVSEEEPEDLFIPESATGGAFHGDTVEALVNKVRYDGKKEGSIVKVTKRGTKYLIGTFDACKNYAFVIPDNPRYTRDIFVTKENFNGARHNDKVEVEITSYGSRNSNPEGRVREVIGNIKRPGAAIYCVAKSFGVPMVFPEEVQEEADKKCAEGIPAQEIARRKDLRDLYTITIDGEDAKDLDDAISVEPVKDGYRLGVHIADVSHYVWENSPLDIEALHRGTSVYLPDRMIPMLPAALSNGICSLNAGEDRLCLSCIMTVDLQGNMQTSEIAETVIRVRERCSYTQVQRFFDEEIEVTPETAELLRNALSLSKILREKRMNRGLVDFDFPEAKIVLDKRGRAVRIDPCFRNDASMLIEDFMLLANETVAETYYWMEIPFLYRTHETPDDDKMKRLSILLRSMGYSLKGQNVHPKELQKLLLEIHGKPEEAFVSRFVLRSMKQARYTVESIGHFGLAVKYYTHFTSPIRRYPDLQIHRIIKEALHGKLDENRSSHYLDILPEVASASSRKERTAKETERECDKLMKAQYMQRHLGETFPGIISSITGWGMYVELENTVEGMVRLSSLRDDYYVFNEDRLELTGDHSLRTFQIGQKVNVLVCAADMNTRTIDFELTD